MKVEPLNLVSFFLFTKIGGEACRGDVAGVTARSMETYLCGKGHRPDGLSQPHQAEG